MTDPSLTVNSKPQQSKSHFSFSLAHLAIISAISMAVMLAVVVYIFYWSAKNVLLESSTQFRERLRLDFNKRADEYFGRAERPMGEIAQLINKGAVPLQDVLGVEREIFNRLSSEPELTEINFTFELAGGSKARISVWRDIGGKNSIVMSRIVTPSGSEFAAKTRQWIEGQSGSQEHSWSKESKAEDPAQNPQYAAVVNNKDTEGFLWRDLVYYFADNALPLDRRRVVCSTQLSVKDVNGRAVGIIQAYLRRDRLDEMVKLSLAQGGKPDPHTIFICDRSGHLITRASSQTPLLEKDGTLRARNDYPFPVNEIVKWVASGNFPEDKTLNENLNGGQFILGGRRLDRINSWLACIVVSEEASFGGMVTLQRAALAGTIIIFVVIFILSVFILRLIRNNLSQLTAQSINMREFDFTRSNTKPNIREMREVMDSMEQAKTSMRSMSKYVPVTLVKQLYQMHAEPTLGSVLTDTTILFTDIKNFTTMAERLSPNDLAIVLGRYLETMSNEIQHHHGTIDKFIGDAVMAIWNAPLPVPNHALQACHGAWACTQALQKLFSSPEWGDYPKLETGFGIHRNDAMIGHFGAPTRFSYTAIGDGVNFSSRLEGLNRLYGTTILVSETVYNEAKHEYLFRLVEIVAVKGKRNGMHIYELIGPLKEAQSKLESVRAYESAFELYLRREFEQAAAIFEKMPNDLPSQILAERCREMLLNPPPAEWDGVHVVKTK